jgi:hypothetical protein
MTKEGYTHIIVPRSLHNQLKTLAQQNNMSISQLINQLINISINVSLKSVLIPVLIPPAKTSPIPALCKL